MREPQGRITGNLLTQCEAKLFKMMNEGNDLEDRSISERYVMQKSIDQNTTD